MITVIPQSEQEHKDVVDLVIEAAQRIEEIELEDGSISKSLVLDPETIYWKTQLVNSPTFGRFVKELKNFEALAKLAYSHMSAPRAKDMAEQILLEVQAYKYSIDGKSSETLGTKDNTQSSLLHVVKSNKIERSYTTKGENKRSIWESFVGSQKEKDAEDD